MNILHKGISISLLALLGTASVFAAPGQGGDEREAARAAQQQGRAMEQNRQQFDRRPAPPGPGQGAEGQGRQGRMSPEERRTLRQQINEANQFIHPPKH
jgi:hypothetical protein